PDGKRVVTASVDGTARLWEIPAMGSAGPITDVRVTVLRGHTDPVIAVAFSPDGALLVTGGWDNTARVWDTGNGARAASPGLRLEEVVALARARAGRQLTDEERKRYVHE